MAKKIDLDSNKPSFITNILLFLLVLVLFMISLLAIIQNIAAL